MKAIEAIKRQIEHQGGIPFVEFMRHALYDPAYGYYSSSMPKFGKQGDFITAPELTPLFGKALANQCRELFAKLPSPCLFEFGAGSGRLCVDILTHLEQLDCLPKEYLILEVSADLQARQKLLIDSEIPHLAKRVKWLNCWPEKPFSGVMIANEVLDAMPVHRFLQSGDGILESYIELDDKKNLIEVFKPCQNQLLLAHVQNCLPSNLYPYQSEANLLIDGWIKACAERLAQGAILLIDYGFPRHEYYHPERNTGTIMCHYRQKAHGDFLAHPGEQDITAHVDFTHVAEAAHDAGFHVAGFASQASFLLSNGILELLAIVANDRERVKEQQAVKQLLQAHEMGELFKVMALTRNLSELTLAGFQLQDRRASL